MRALHAVVRRPAWVIAAWAALLAGALGLASRLQLKTSFHALLPSTDPAVVELERLGEILDGTAILQIAVEGPSRDENVRFAGALAERLRALPRDVVSSVVWDVRDERAWFERRLWLYAPRADLERLVERLERELGKRTSPLYVDLLDEEPLRETVEKMRTRARRLDSFPTGIIEGEGGRLVVVVARPAGGLFAERAGEALVAAARAAVAALAPERRGVTVGYTGDVMAQLEERAALESDLVTATALCVSLVCLVVVLFFGRLRALVFVALPALVGAAVALGLAAPFVGALNASTAFLGSILVGNGINFPIIVLARIDEDRRARGGGPLDGEGLASAVAAALRPTLLAAGGAAVAYGALLVTRFRGFSQFGAIAALGMAVAWLAAVTLLPALYTVAGGAAPIAAARRPPGFTQLARLAARAALGRPRWVLVLVAAALVVAAWPLPRLLHDPFEYDFNRLRNRRSFTSGAARLAARVDPLFDGGLTLTPAVVVAPRPEDARAVRDAILLRDARGAKLFARVTTVDDFLPGDAAEQAEKRALLARLRRLVASPTVASELRGLGADAQRLVDELRATAALPEEALRAAELPEAVRRPFTERDGTLGRLVLVHHAPSVSVWDGHVLEQIADEIETVPLPDGRVVRSSGHAVVFAAMIRAIAADAPRSALAAIGGTLALVVLLGGRGRRARAATVATLVSLGAGVVTMLGLAAWVGERASFLNFIALPITCGIGVDYAVNIAQRWRQGDTLERAVEATGGAVILSSLTTIIGYGALLVADSRALVSFGAIAMLGEATCLAAALLLAPAILATIGRATESRASSAPPGDAS